MSSGIKFSSLPVKDQLTSMRKDIVGFQNKIKDVDENIGTLQSLYEEMDRGIKDLKYMVESEIVTRLPNIGGSRRSKRSRKNKKTQKRRH